MRRNSLRKQQEPFVFTPENTEKLNQHIAKYPEGRQASAVMPALDLAQRQNGGWIPKEAIETIASMLGMPVIKVWEVATFYSMYNLEPVGKNLIQVCRTTSCWLRGSDKVFEACKKHANVEVGRPSEDGLFSLMEVECLGACVNAPMVQINDDYYEDLDEEKMAAIMSDLKKGEEPKVGPQVDRLNSAPISGATTNLKLVSPAGTPTDKIPGNVPASMKDRVKKGASQNTQEIDETKMSAEDLKKVKGDGYGAVKKTSSKSSAKTSNGASKSSAVKKTPKKSPKKSTTKPTTKKD